MSRTHRQKKLAETARRRPFRAFPTVAITSECDAGLDTVWRAERFSVGFVDVLAAKPFVVVRGPLTVLRPDFLVGKGQRMRRFGSLEKAAQAAAEANQRE